MTPRATLIVNYTLYQAGWLAAVGGAAVAHGEAGAGLAAALIAAHLWLTRQRAVELRLLVLATLTGLAVEAWQLQAGTYRVLSGAAPAATPPLWLLALWAQFATTFRYSLRRVLARPWTALLFGAIGGPLAFVAGERLGAVELTTPVWPGLLRLARGLDAGPGRLLVGRARRWRHRAAALPSCSGVAETTTGKVVSVTGPVTNARRGYDGSVPRSSAATSSTSIVRVTGLCSRVALGPVAALASSCSA